MVLHDIVRASPADIARRCPKAPMGVLSCSGRHAQGCPVLRVRKTAVRITAMEHQHLWCLAGGRAGVCVSHSIAWTREPTYAGLPPILAARRTNSRVQWIQAKPRGSVSTLSLGGSARSVPQVARTQKSPPARRALRAGFWNSHHRYRQHSCPSPRPSVAWCSRGPGACSFRAARPVTPEEAVRRH